MGCGHSRSTPQKCSDALDDTDSGSVRQGPQAQPLDLHRDRAPRLSLWLTVCAPPPGHPEHCGLAELPRGGWKSKGVLCTEHDEFEEVISTG